MTELTQFFSVISKKIRSKTEKEKQLQTKLKPGKGILRNKERSKPEMHPTHLSSPPDNIRL